MKLYTGRIIPEMFEQFKILDEFRNQFKNEFAEAFTSILDEQFHIAPTDQVAEFLNLMAEEAMSFVEAVIDKDRNYPEYRKEFELSAFSTLLEKQQDCEVDDGKAESVKYELNVLLLKHYPAIYELSSFGYRLLDRNVQFYTCQFMKATKLENYNSKFH